MTELEKTQLKEYKKYLRLSSERELYTIPQAAFRLGISRNEFERTYVTTGVIVLRLREGKKFVASSEIKKAVDMMQTIISSQTIHITPKYFQTKMNISKECREVFNGVMR